MTVLYGLACRAGPVPNHASPAVIRCVASRFLQQQRTVGIKSGKGAFGRTRGRPRADGDTERGAAREPRFAHRAEPARAPSAVPDSEAGEQRRQGRGGHRRNAALRLHGGGFGRAGAQVYADAEQGGTTFRLDQDAGEFLAVCKHVVRPFQRCRTGRAKPGVDRLGSRDGGEKAEIGQPRAG